MNFKNVKTYGRFKNRVIKTDLWISPQVQRNRLFSSTSSESSINSTGNKSEQTSDVGADHVQRASDSLSSEKVSPDAESSGDFLCQQSSLEKENNSPVLVEHSTPYSARGRAAVRPRRLPVISPLVAESPLEGSVVHYDSPNLFSNTTQENCVSSAGDDGARCSVPVKNGGIHNSGNKSEDGNTTDSERGDGFCRTTNKVEERCITDWTTELSEDDLSLKSQISNSSATTTCSLELELKLQKLSTSDVESLSNKVKSLSRSKDATRYDLRNNVDNCLNENLCASHKVACRERQVDSESNRCTCNQSFSKKNSSIECYKDFDESLQYKETLPAWGEMGSLPKVQNISNSGQDLSTEKEPPNGHSSEINISNIDHSCNVLPDDCKQDEDNKDRTKSVDFENMKTLPKKLTGLCLLDAKVYLNKREGFTSSGAVKNSSISAPQNSARSINVNGNLPQQSSGISRMGRSAEEVTPNNGTQTPLNYQHTGKIKNPNYSSFVEALTPAIISQCRKRTPLSPKDRILVQCEQRKVLKFTDVLSPSVLAKCVKVGEGTYGEVYKTNDGVEDIALKVIPVEGNFTVNDEPQKSFEEMIPEIVISKELSSLAECDDVQNAVHVCSNFVKVRRVMLVQDSYHEKLLQEWDRWKTKHNCENERPDMFKSDQYFIVFEFLNGGEDLERFQFNSMDEALSVLQQVAISLSVAEQSLLFEHRDLHWGNVLIKRTNSKEIHYKLCGEDIFVKSAGVFVCIIDFTLSRLTKDGMTVYCDLSKDPDIFKGKGDYQFQVYRLMRKANGNDWESHEPYSNVLWIRYLIDKVLKAKKYKKANNSIQRSIRTCFRQVLSYNSALEAVQDGFLGLDVGDER